MTVINLPIVSNKRECGTCTKCCEGYLRADVKFDNRELIELGPNACPILKIGKGCGDHENRPEDPCRIYKCLWLENENLPDEFYPFKSGVIMDIHIIENFKYLRLTPAGNDPDVGMLTWAIQYVYSNNLGLWWSVDGYKHWVGSVEFCNAMSRQYE